ncbi:MAG: hypothetical protein U5K29_13930 [Acidimicrobiales bacterium]|nr:hypothetical protein [Acidimicrobiales bacterium]
MTWITSVLAYHGTGHGGGGDGSSSWTLLIVVLGLFATAGWFIFSELQFRNTVLAAVGAWSTGLALLFLM